MSSKFRSFTEMFAPIRIGRDAQDTSSPLTSYDDATSCRERADMSLESVTTTPQTKVGTVTGDTQAVSEEAFLRELEHFRAYALETLECSVDRLLTSLAEEVLGRELLLAPADVAEITQRAMRRYEREGPLRLRVSAADLNTITCSLPMVVDGELQPGDFILEVRDGVLDARLPVRLGCVLRRFQQVSRESNEGAVA